MKVLSLFDGMSCGMLALNRAGIPVESYHASEIDKFAIQVSQDNWSNIDHVGNGKQLHYDFNEQLLFTNIKASASFRCYIPDCDVEFLKDMNKIVEDTQTTTHSVC